MDPFWGGRWKGFKMKKNEGSTFTKKMGFVDIKRCKEIFDFQLLTLVKLERLRSNRPLSAVISWEFIVKSKWPPGFRILLNTFYNNIMYYKTKNISVWCSNLGNQVGQQRNLVFAKSQILYRLNSFQKV